MVQAEVTPIDHRCVAFRSSVNFYLCFLPYNFFHNLFFVDQVERLARFPKS